MSGRARRVAIVFLAAVLLRSLAMLTPFDTDRLFGDEREYATLARNLATRGVFEAPWITDESLRAHRTPVFPAYLALNHLVAGEEAFVRSAKIMNVFVGSSIPLLVFLCVELLLGVDTPRKRRAPTGAGSPPRPIRT
jgi:hypothetical protein